MKWSIKFLTRINKYSLFISKCFYKFKLFFLGRFFGYFRQKVTISVLTKITEDLYTKKYDYSKLIKRDDHKVFVMWYQGFSELPQIIHECIESIKKHIPSKSIIFISRNNILDYLDIPDYIISKVDAGLISKTHFSDICRVGLLNKYGGTWIDAAVFLTKDIPADYFEKSFYSPSGIYSEIKKDFRFLFQKTNGWNISFQGSVFKNFPLYDFLYNSYLLFFKNNDCILDYFQTDFLISIFLKHNKDFYEIINSQIPNNQNEFDLALIMNKYVTSKTIKQLNNILETDIHKLTYKKNWVKERNNKTTIYGYIINRFGDIKI